MKIKSLFFILFLFTNLYSQINSDTLTVPHVISDSLAQDSTAADTTALIGDSLKITKRDSLAAIHQLPLYPGSFFIPNRKMMFTDYRYAADFLELFPFTFVLDQGFIGQPNEVLIYGTGFNSISYLQDGILFNDRRSNSLDLNIIQSESIDSIEIIPAPRGFLYGPVNNLVSINLLTKEFLPKVPYTRVKYYEGPSGEAMFDGIFSTMLFKKLNFYSDITNRTTDESFDNSSFSIWQVSTKLKYFLSNKINLTGSYYFVHSETGINGGVDVDSIRQVTSNVDSILYNENFAPVVQPNGHQKIKQHHFGLRMLWNPQENLKTDLNLYYKFYLSERENIENYSSGLNLLNGNLKNKVWGGDLRQTYSSQSKIGILNSQLNINYEYQELIERDRIQYDSILIPDEYSINKNVLSISPIISVLSQDSNFAVSLFYKYLGEFTTQIELAGLHGAGLDLFYKINSNKFYFGYSEFQIKGYSERIRTMELGVKLLYLNSLIDLRIFNRYGPRIIPWFSYPERSELIVGEDFWRFRSFWGFGLNGDINIWILNLEFQSFYYLYENKSNNEFQFRGGIFYKDVLFNSSLDLKTGFNVYYFGKHNVLLLNNIKTFSVNPSSRIDFTLAGEIQKSAIAYFAWENLLGESYYIVPYYPMPGRSIRFGVTWEILN